MARRGVHDSGLRPLGAASGTTRRAFNNDLLSLNPRQPQRKQEPEGRHGPCRVAASTISMLVREPGRAGQTQVQLFNGPDRSLGGATSAGLRQQNGYAVHSPGCWARCNSKQSCPSNCMRVHAMGIRNIRPNLPCYQPKIDRNSGQNHLVSAIERGGLSRPSAGIATSLSCNQGGQYEH